MKRTENWDVNDRGLDSGQSSQTTKPMQGVPLSTSERGAPRSGVQKVSFPLLSGHREKEASPPWPLSTGREQPEGALGLFWLLWSKVRTLTA